MDPELDWFIAVVNPNTERACETKLRTLFRDNPEAEFVTYVPVQRELREQPSTGRRVWIDKVLCRGYLFIQSTPRVRYQIACRAKFIHFFMMDRARMTPEGRNDFARIPPHQMLNFQRMVGDAETPITIDPSLLHAGSKVRVKSGRFEGVEGILDRDPNGSSQLAIRVDFLGYAKMAFPLALLELLED